MTPGELRRARKRLDLDQVTLGERLGVGRQHVSAMETGRARIHESTALAVRYLLLLRTVVEGEQVWIVTSPRGQTDLRVGTDAQEVVNELCFELEVEALPLGWGIRQYVPSGTEE